MPNEHVFKSPVKPGDPLWWASETADDGPGPSLIQARRSDGAVEAVLFDGDGLSVVTDSGNKETPGTQYACLDETSCLDWIKKNRPGAVLLSGQTVKAVHMCLDGTKEMIELECTISAIEQLFSTSSLLSGTMDEYGQFFICDAAANQTNTPITTFVRDTAGNPVLAIHGEFIRIRALSDEKSGMLSPVDLTDEVLAAMEEQDGNAPSAAAYDPDFWTEAYGMTAGALKRYLDRLPENAVVHCCGTAQCWLHYAPATETLSMDCESLSELPEYEGRTPAFLEGNGE